MTSIEIVKILWLSTKTYTTNNSRQIGAFMGLSMGTVVKSIILTMNVGKNMNYMIWFLRQARKRDNDDSSKIIF